MNFAITTSSDGALVQLQGPINENCEAALQDIVAQLTNVPIRFDCEGIDYINSVGVLRWVEFLSSLNARKLVFTFERCAPVFFDYSRIMKMFAPAGTIQSLMVPFACEACDLETLSLIPCADLNSRVLQGVLCSSCGGKAEADCEYYE